MEVIGGPGNPHRKRWMMFVDGENLTIRAQKLAKKEGWSLEGYKHWVKDVLLWFSGHGQSPVSQTPDGDLHNSSIRSFYYTSAVGADDGLAKIREQLWEMKFSPQVFKKRKQREKAKGVDIALTKDLLANAFRDNFDVAILVAGDGDYVPVVEEVKRLGKIVHVHFFIEEGLSPALKLAADHFHDLTGKLRTVLT